MSRKSNRALLKTVKNLQLSSSYKKTLGSLKELGDYINTHIDCNHQNCLKIYSLFLEKVRIQTSFVLIEPFRKEYDQYLTEVENTVAMAEEIFNEKEKKIERINILSFNGYDVLIPIQE